MRIREVITNYLFENGCDGLFNQHAECACELADLMPCGGDSSECLPGYRHPCDCGEHLFHISAEKSAGGQNHAR